LDRELAAAALLKRKRREQPTRNEQAALRRVEQAREEEDRWRYYSSIPKKHWREMSGRSNKVLIEQAARYGLPFGERVIDLPAVVLALHDFLAKNKYRLIGVDADPVLAGPDSKALERYRLARAKREEWFYERDKREWLPRAEVHEGLAVLSRILREAGETLLRQCGSDAHEILDDAINDAERAFDNHFGNCDPNDD